MQEVELDKIVNLVVKEVVSQLQDKGVKVVTTNSTNSNPSINPDEDGYKTRTEKINMEKYKSPILTGRQLRNLHELTGKILIPEGTVITPKAKDIIKKKNLAVGYE